MRVGLGVSTGSEVVCGALVVADDDGTVSVDYRTVSSDRQANTDTGDLVTSAIDLIASLAPHRPDTIAVSYRTPEQASAIRSAVAHTRREVALVSESAAAMAFLSGTGLVDRYDTVGLVDLGATGLTVTVVDSHTGTIHACERTDQVGGDIIDAVVKDLVHQVAAPATDDIRDYIRDDHGVGSARYRAVKEDLSTADEAFVERYSGAPVVITRGAYEAAIGARITGAMHFAQRVFAESLREPEVVVLFGGSARIPLLHRTFESALDIVVLVADEPDAVLAKGAAHVAASAPSARYPVVTVSGGERNRALGRFSGALVAATVAGGLVLAYGVEALTPTESSNVSPAGSAASDTTPNLPGDIPAADAGGVTSTNTIGSRPTGVPTPSNPVVQPAASTGVDATSTPGQQSGSTRPTTPALYPDPDLPSIPWPILTTPAAPVRTTPPMPVQTTVPPSEAPGESTELPGPTPSEPSTGFPEIVLPTTPPIIPTTDPGTPSTPPELSPPPTVWAPPTAGPSGESAEGIRPEAPAAGVSAGSEEGVRPETSSVTPSVTPTRAELSPGPSS